MYERDKEFYQNIIKEYFKLSEEDSFISDEISDDLIKGIEYSIKEFGFGEDFQDVLTLRYQKHCTYKEIATLTGKSGVVIASKLDSFRKRLRFSPYRIYFIRGFKEGEAHEQSLRRLIKNAISPDKEGYEEYKTDIDRLNTVWLGFFDISIDAVSKLYKQNVKTLGILHSYSKNDWKGYFKDLKKSDITKMEELFTRLGLFDHPSWTEEE